LINYRKGWYGHILRLNEERHPKKVLNIKLNEKCPRGWPRWEHMDRRYHAEGRNNIGNLGKCEEVRHRWKGLAA
jgi:hypothetical protein